MERKGVWFGDNDKIDCTKRKRIPNSRIDFSCCDPLSIKITVFATEILQRTITLESTAIVTIEGE